MDAGSAVKRLEQSYREGSHCSQEFPTDPILASLRNDQRYLLFLSKISDPVPEIPGFRQQ